MPSSEDMRRVAGAIPNPYDPTPTRVREYTAKEIATLQSRLEKQLGPEFISTRAGAGGGKVPYLAGEKAINLANEVFGFNGWSSEIRNTQVDFVDETSSGGRVSLGLSIIIRVTLRDGTFHEDIGYGQIENCRGKAAAFEKAKKEAVTDSLKRALRNFGNVLGNCLYDKNYCSKVQKMKVGPTRWDTDQLHRHPDFAPPKKEPDTVAVTPAADAKAVVARSDSTLEEEDEFGANLFDDADFNMANYDDTTLPPSPVTRNEERQPARIQNPSGTDTAQGVPMIKSLPDLNRDTGPQHARGPGYAEVPSVAPIQHRPNGQNTGPAPNLPRPTEAVQPRSVDKNASPGFPPGQRHAMPPPRTSFDNRQPMAPPESRPKPNTMNNERPQTDNTRPGAEARSDIQQDHTGDMPEVGFITSRAADDLLKADGPKSAVSQNLPSFNPHAESPSIRRTGGVNHSVSAPIVRENVGVAAGNQPKAPKTNYVNPMADPNRRVGAPGRAGSPMGNRAAYKPPQVVSGKRMSDGQPRAPLSDVSNVQVDAAGNGAAVDNAKRQKL